MTADNEIFGTGLLWPDEAASEDGRLGWLSRDAVPDPAIAIVAAAREFGCLPGDLYLTPVLMREESEVEAKINGHEFPLWVECTKRAKAHEAFWRLERRRR